MLFYLCLILFLETMSRPHLKKIDLFALSFKLWVIVMVIFPILFLPVVIFEGLDPWHHIFIDLIPEYYSNPVIRLLLALLRFVMAYLIVIEYQRLVFYSFITFVMIGMNQWNASVSLLDKYYKLVKQQRSNLSYVKLYRRLLIMQQIMHPVQTNMSTAVWILIFLITLFSCFATIRMYHVIPMPLYLLAPMFICLGLYLAALVIPSAAKFHDNSKLVLLRWRSDVATWVSNKDRKLVLQTLRSLQPLGFCLGISGVNFFTIKRSTKSTYFEVLTTHTINLLLIVPPRFVDLSYVFSNINGIVFHYVNQVSNQNVK